MGTCPASMSFFAFSLLILQTLEVVNAAACFGGSFIETKSYVQNRNNLFASLAEKVVANGGFYHASLGQSPNQFNALGLCARGYEREACSSCVERLIQDIRPNCLNRTDSYVWGSDDEDKVSCLVRFSNHSTFGKLELDPAVIYPSALRIEESRNVSLFTQQWEATVNRTFEAATEAEPSSVLKYYSAVEAKFTEFPNVYMLMQCTPDLTSRDCNRCLGECIKVFREQFRGRQGGMASRPSCFFRWDLYAFHGAFGNVTRLFKGVGCAGGFFNADNVQNRDDLFSTLADKVVPNGGFYNVSLGKIPNRVHALVLCGRGYEQQACINCVQNVTREIQSSCQNRTDSFKWDTDGSCLVRFSNYSTFRNLELNPPVIWLNPLRIEPSKDMTLFKQEWESMANRTLETAMETETSSVLKYYGALEVVFTEFPNVYMLMQCTPDLTSGECKICLEECVTLFKNQSWGRQGGDVSRPSCVFRWDLHAFHNVTTVPAPPKAQAQPPVQGSSIQDKKGRSIRYGGIIAVIVPSFINLLVFIGLIKFYAQRRRSKDRINIGSAEYSDSNGQLMLRFDLGMILMATNDFSSENMLGQGGFGTVHKGRLPNGQEIAVKRLTKGSGQGDTEFKNEVSLLTRLQHRNLVKLLGFCCEADEEILVYEFVPNSSLDHFIFDEEKRSLLTWEVRFRIIEGVARGLVYLHEDSQLKIIHRDLKASNILLDAEMNPKVADFGTARLFNTDETRAETKRIAGTRGYMAPEYLNHGQISVKSDVFSFGVMLLEMISGEKNNSFEGQGLAAFAWKRWVERRPEVIIDPFLVENPRDEIIKLIQIGLLCVQENATKRPTMSSVIVWLGSETITIPLPKAPAFTWNQSQSEDGTMSMSKVFTELSSR